MSEIKISQQEWKKIQRKISKLDALESGGVDNWSYYWEALGDWRKEGAIEDTITDFIEEFDEGVLVDGVDFDFPAGREAGISIRINEHGADLLDSLLRAYYSKIKELEDE